MRSHMLTVFVLLVAGCGGGLPMAPSRHAVVDALNAVTPAVERCGESEHGRAQVRIEFDGGTGLMRDASMVDGDGFSAPVQQCILDAVRRIRVPPFGQETFSVSYPFRL